MIYVIEPLAISSAEKHKHGCIAHLAVNRDTFIINK